MRPVIRFRTIERDVLRQKIDLTNTNATPLTLLHAPAGYGKTVAVLKWLEASGIPEDQTYWLQVSGEWSNPQEDFWRHLHEAVTSTGRAIDSPVETSHLWKADTERALRQLATPTILVIDNYQFVTSPDFDLQIAALTELSPELYIYVISRRFAALDGPMVTSRIGTVIIGVQDLIFTLDEVVRLSALYGIDRTEAVAEIHEATGGWAFAVQGALAEMNQLDATLYTPVTGRFAEESIESIDNQNVVKALLAVALCENITIEMVSGLIELSIKECTNIMKDLEDLGLVSRTWYPRRVRFKCHPALASVIKDRAIKEFGEQRSTYLRRSHALGLTADDPMASLSGLFEIGDCESAERVLIWNFGELAQPGTGLLELLRNLQNRDIEEHLGLMAARLYLEIEDASAPIHMLEEWRRRLQEVTRQHLFTGNPEYRVFALSTLMSTERLGGDGPESYRLAIDLEKRLTDTSDHNLSSVRSSLPLLYILLALAGLMNGDFDMAYRSFGRAQAAAASDNSDLYHLGALSGLALTTAVVGDFHLTQHYIDQRLELVRKSQRQWPPELSDVHLTVAKSLMASNEGRGSEAISMLHHVKEFANRMDHLVLYVLAQSIAVRVNDGNREAVLALQRAQSNTQSVFHLVPYQRSILAAQVATLHMLGSDFAAAEQQLQRLPGDHPDVVLARARLSLLVGKYHEAVRIVDRARTGRLTSHREIEAHFITAVANWELGSRHEAFQALRRGGTLRLTTGGGAACFSTVPYDSLLELAKAARDEDVMDLVGAIEAVPETLRCLQFEQLTRAEVNVLGALSSTRSLREAAEHLFISQNTLKTHLRSIYRKLRVLNRHEAVRRGQQIGIIE